MKFGVSSWKMPELYNEARVIFVLGSSNFLNGLIVKSGKQFCKPKDIEVDENELFDEFGITVNTGTTANNVDLATFKDVVITPCIDGRWFCSADIGSMSKQEIEWVEQYIKHPSKYGLLTVTCTDYKLYRKYLRFTLFATSKTCHLVQASFPRYADLIQIVNSLFNENGKRVAKRAVELFINRLGSAYDDYTAVIDKVCAECKIGLNGSQKIISYEDMNILLVGVDNYDIDDFLEYLMKPTKTTKVSAQRRIYKAFGSLTNDIGAQVLVGRLIKKVQEIIKFREAINLGFIPVNIEYSVDEVKNRLGESHVLYKIGNFAFRRRAELASTTSMRDWVYVYCILLGANQRSEVDCTRAVYEIMNRSMMGAVALEGSLKMYDIFGGWQHEIDSIKAVD